MQPMKKLDWTLLREQKQWLLLHDCDEARGLTHLLDALQDEAVDSGMFTENEVFGIDAA